MLSRSEVVSHFFLCDGEGVSRRRRRRGVEGCRGGIKGARVGGGRGREREEIGGREGMEKWREEGRKYG